MRLSLQKVSRELDRLFPLSERGVGDRGAQTDVGNLVPKSVQVGMARGVVRLGVREGGMEVSCGITGLESGHFCER